MRNSICVFAVATMIFSSAVASVAECGDVDDSGNVSASDALKVLRKSVGIDVALVCGGECAVLESRVDARIEAKVKPIKADLAIIKHAVGVLLTRLT